MKVIRQQNFVYTLFEDERGAYIFDLLMPAPKAASVLYTKQIKASMIQRWLIWIHPKMADVIADRLINEEKERVLKSLR